MTTYPRCLRAAFLLSLPPLGLGLAMSFAVASAQTKTVETPAYRRLEAIEPMAAPGGDGNDASANPASLAGLTLLATIPAPPVPRRGYLIQAQCTAGLTVAFDDPTGSETPTLAILAGSAGNGGQGGSLDMSGMPHTGRIRIYSSDAVCQMAARSW